MESRQDTINKYFGERLNSIELVLKSHQELLTKAFVEINEAKKVANESKLTFSLKTHEMPLINGDVSKLWLKSREVEVIKERWDVFKKLYEEGLTLRQIAKKFNISYDSVKYARRCGWVSKYNKPKSHKRVSFAL